MLGQTSPKQTGMAFKAFFATFLLVFACLMSGLRVSAMPSKGISSARLLSKQIMKPVLSSGVGSILPLQLQGISFGAIQSSSISVAQQVAESAEAPSKNSSHDSDRDADREQDDLDFDSDLSDQVFAALPVRVLEVVVHVEKTQYHMLSQFGASLVLPVEIPPPKV